MKCIDNKYLIKLPSDISINISALQYHSVIINIVASLDFNVDVMEINKFYECNIRNRKKRVKSIYDIDQYEPVQITNNNIVINSSGCSTGAYVKTYDRLIRFKLLLQEQVYMDINNDMINFHDLLLYKKKMQTNKHRLTLLYSFNKILPSELIKIIENYVTDDMDEYEYMYHFKFNDRSKKSAI